MIPALRARAALFELFDYLHFAICGPRRVWRQWRRRGDDGGSGRRPSPSSESSESVASARRAASIVNNHS